MARRQRFDLAERHGVVAAHDRIAAQFADVPGQVVDEGVVVIDEEDHGGLTKRIDHTAGLVERLAVLLFGIRIGDDPAAGAEVYATAERHRRADGDAAVERARDAPVADGPAIDAPLGRFELGDDLHRAHLGRAGNGAAGK